MPTQVLHRFIQAINKDKIKFSNIKTKAISSSDLLNSPHFINHEHISSLSEHDKSQGDVSSPINSTLIRSVFPANTERACMSLKGVAAFFPIFLFLQILIQFRLAKVISHVRDKYWFQRLLCEQSSELMVFFFRELLLLVKGLQGTLPDCYKHLVMGITEMHPMCS